MFPEIKINMPAQEHKTIERCSRCKLDMDKPAELGGCKCCRSHPRGTPGSSGDRMDEGLYDGYGWYDMARYQLDQ